MFPNPSRREVESLSPSHETFAIGGAEEKLNGGILGWMALLLQNYTFFKKLLLKGGLNEGFEGS